METCYQFANRKQLLFSRHARNRTLTLSRLQDLRSRSRWWEDGPARGGKEKPRVAANTGLKTELKRAAKTPEVKKWLEKHPRFACHFIPTSSSWLNMVERWFRELTDKAIRRGAFVSVPDLEKAIADYLAAWNDNPRPFIWTATLGKIVEKLARARAKLELIKPGCTQPPRRKTRQTANV